jgi:hypothetical protein
MQRSNAHIPESSAGLTLEEAIEFEVLDALPPFDDNGEIGWTFQGNPTGHREKRWLELYTKLKASHPSDGLPTGPKIRRSNTRPSLITR